jgi:shikimate dehydrogenase
VQHFGLIGQNLTHSFSKKHFTQKFETENIAAQYHNIEIETISQITPYLNPTKYSGFNVTIPYKKQIIPYLASLSPEASEIGAVNCIAYQNKNWIGYNTDALAFKTTLEQFLPPKLNNLKAIIFGNGGAAAAVIWALQQLNIPYIQVVRNATILNNQTQQISYTNLTHTQAQEHKLWINTTPVGTLNHQQQLLNIPYLALSPNHFVYDLVYNPALTPLIMQAQAQNASTINGYKMLIMQAKTAYKIWCEKNVGILQ